MSAEEHPLPELAFDSWRCGHCFRVNVCSNGLCSKCQQPRHEDPELGYRASARVIYFFQAFLLLLGVLAVIGLKPGLFFSVLILLGLWWAGLGLFFGHAAINRHGYKFELERRSAREFIAIQESAVGRALVTCTYRVLYWPIFIPERVYFWGAITLVLGYLYLTIFH